VIGHQCRLKRLNRERSMFLYQKNGMTRVSSALKQFSIVRVDQDMILDLKLHLQPFSKKIIKTKTTSFTISQYWNMVYEGREVSAST
jgi:hypothetical protein